MTLLLIDTSHHNAIPDFARLKAAGVAGVIHKITEGTGFVDPDFPAVRAGCHAEGLIFGGYAFSRLGDPHAEARFFLDTMRPQPGELVAEDLEVAVAGVDPVGWTVTWSTDVHAALSCWPLLYGNQSEFGSHNWAPVIALGDGQWLAKYDGVPTGTPVGGWPVLTMKQYTDSASIPGEAGLVDADAFQGDLAALLRYAVPGGSDMPLTQADVDAVWHSETVLRADASTGGQTEHIAVIQEVADGKSFAYAALVAVQALAGQVAGLATAVQHLSGGSVDMAAITAAAQQGAAEALSKATFTVVGAPPAAAA